MNNQQTVAKRYAKALFEAAREKDCAAEVEAQLEALVLAIRENEDVQKFLTHPKIAPSVKMDVLRAAFKDGLAEVLENTLRLLIERRREAAVTALHEAYVAISDEALGQVGAVVSTPFPLNEEQVKQVAAVFGEITGKRIRIRQRIDESLLGGITVRIGDRLYDGSLKGKIESIRKKLHSQAI